MKIIRKYAEFVGYVFHCGKSFREWRCPDCGMGVSEEYRCCPYCSRKIKFRKPAAVKTIGISMERRARQNWFKRG